MTKPEQDAVLPAISEGLKQRVLERGRSVVMSEPADIEPIMKAASTTLVDPGVLMDDYVGSERRKTPRPVVGAGDVGKKPKLNHVYIDAEVGFLLKEAAARGRMSPRVLLEAIIKAACSGETSKDDRVKRGSGS